MITIEYIVVYLAFCAVNIIIAKANDMTRRRRIRLKNPKQIEHPLYAIGYCILVASVCLPLRIWWEIGAVLPLHISVFTVAFNIYSGQPAFNLSRTSTAITDRALVRWGFKSYEDVAVFAFVASIALLITQIIKK